MEPCVSPADVALSDTQSFLDEITRIFRDSDEKATAARELEWLKQGSRDFARYYGYYADFACLTAILDLIEETKMQALKRGVSNEIRNAMAYQDTPENETLDNYIGRLKRMDERLRRIRGQPKAAPIAPQNPKPPAIPSTATDTHPGPMDLSAARKPLSPEERGRRIAEGLCFYCSGSGLMARACPNRPGQRPARDPQAQARIAGAVVVKLRGSHICNL